MSASILVVFPACTPRDAVAGWRLDGEAVNSDQSVVISRAAEEIAVILTLPNGFTAADGFAQRITVSAANQVDEYEIGATGEITVVPIPDTGQIEMTLTIGFCSITAKEICYVDRAELTVTRVQTQSQAARIELRYTPEEPS